MQLGYLVQSKPVRCIVISLTNLKKTQAETYRQRLDISQGTEIFLFPLCYIQVLLLGRNTTWIRVVSQPQQPQTWQLNRHVNVLHLSSSVCPSGAEGYVSSWELFYFTSLTGRTWEIKTTLICLEVNSSYGLKCLPADTFRKLAESLISWAPKYWKCMSTVFN